MMMVVLPAPVSPMIYVLRLGLRGIRSISFRSVVLIPMPSPWTLLLNSFGVSRSGPLSRRPYFISLRRMTSWRIEKGS